MRSPTASSWRRSGTTRPSPRRSSPPTWPASSWRTRRPRLRALRRRRSPSRGLSISRARRPLLWILCTRREPMMLWCYDSMTAAQTDVCMFCCSRLSPIASCPASRLLCQYRRVSATDGRVREGSQPPNMSRGRVRMQEGPEVAGRGEGERLRRCRSSHERPRAADEHERRENSRVSCRGAAPGCPAMSL